MSGQETNVGSSALTNHGRSFGGAEPRSCDGLPGKPVGPVDHGYLGQMRYITGVSSNLILTTLEAGD